MVIIYIYNTDDLNLEKKLEKKYVHPSHPRDSPHLITPLLSHYTAILLDS
jgi:hypothetical protein